MNASGSRPKHALALAISTKQGLISKINPHATSLFPQNGSPKPKTLVSLRNLRLINALQRHAALIYTKDNRLPLTATHSSSGNQVKLLLISHLF